MRSKTALGALAIVVMGLLSACGAATSSVHVTPSESAAAQAAKTRGIKVIESCVPNGVAMIGGIFNHTATPLTYYQGYKYFKVAANRTALWNCAS